MAAILVPALVMDILSGYYNTMIMFYIIGSFFGMNSRERRRQKPAMRGIIPPTRTASLAYERIDMASQPIRRSRRSDHRDKTASEYDIEARWREVLLHGALGGRLSASLRRTARRVSAATRRRWRDL
jgi:hypothetical protein